MKLDKGWFVAAIAVGLVLLVTETLACPVDPAVAEKARLGVGCDMPSGTLRERPKESVEVVLVVFATVSSAVCKALCGGWVKAGNKGGL
jgi:hypothetical protein